MSGGIHFSSHVLPSVGGATMTVVKTTITTGNIALPDTSGVWEIVDGVELSTAAAVGDYVELAAAFLMNLTGGDQFLDFAVVVGSAVVRYATTDTASRPPGDDGLPDLYHTTTFPRVGGWWGFEVTEDDLDGAEVRFCIVTKGPGGAPRTLYASVAYPMRLRVVNYGPVLAS